MQRAWDLAVVGMGAEREELCKGIVSELGKETKTWEASGALEASKAS